MRQVIAILWLAVPVFVLGQALIGLWRRWRLLRRAEPIEAKVIEVRASHVERLEDATIVDVIVSYMVAGSTYEHAETKTDHQRRFYQVGSLLLLIYERGNPANVIDASRRPWDDVIGPLVFALLLLLFMAWVLQFVTSLI